MKIKLFIIFAFFLVLSLLIVSASQLQVTSEHPFLVNGNWIPAKQLQVGDKLKTADGKNARITGIERVSSPAIVYNLEASPYNNFVLSDGLIVHNSNAVGEGIYYKISRYLSWPDETRAYVVNVKGEGRAFITNWKETSKAVGAEGDFKEIITHIDEADEALAVMIRAEYGKTFSNLPANPTSVQLECVTSRFTETLHDKLPFLGWKNIVSLQRVMGGEGGDQALNKAMLYYFDFVREGESLKNLGKVGQLDCIGQTLTIRAALGGESSGWMIYTDVYPGMHTRTHILLAKKFGDNWAIVDSTELLGDCGHGYVQPNVPLRYPEVIELK